MENCYVEIEIIISENKAFALFPFKFQYFENFQKIIKPAFKSNNMICEHAGDENRPTDIKIDIWNYIRNAKILIADISGLNANVFYEMGLAHALGKPLIIIKDSDTKSPFDIHGIRTIEYDISKKTWKNTLKKQITSSIKAIIENNMKPIYPEINLRKIKKSHETRIVNQGSKDLSEEDKRKENKFLEIKMKETKNTLKEMLSIKNPSTSNIFYMRLLGIAFQSLKLGFKSEEYITSESKIEHYVSFDNYKITSSGIHYLNDERKKVSIDRFFQDLKNYWKEKFKIIID